MTRNRLAFRRLCVNTNCGARPWYLLEKKPPGVGGEDTYLIQEHDIVHDFLTGPCVGSLMRFPFDEDTLARIREREEIENRRVDEMIRADLIGDPGGPHPMESDTRNWRPVSQSLRGSHRMGREPDNTDRDDWQIGGRADEEIIPMGTEGRTPAIPADVQGTPIKGTGMTSINELVELISAANMKASEGVASLRLADTNLMHTREALMEAYNAILVARGTAESDQLNSYLSILTQAIQDLDAMRGSADQMITHIQVGEEKGRDYIGRLMS